MTQRLELIFVHLPKAGGSSLSVAIEEHFSPARVLRDYDDRPNDPTSPMNLDPLGFLERVRNRNEAVLSGKAAIFGHFWIKKYDNVAADRRAIILREPISRAISHYFFWKSAAFDHPLQKYVIANGPSFLQFARLPRVNSLYTQVYCRGVDMGCFDFVGNQDRLLRDWAGTAIALGLQPAPPRRELNTTAAHDPDYAAKRSQILCDASLMAQLRDIFADDLRFYERYALR
jgi:hypothetical protein